MKRKNSRRAQRVIEIGNLERDSPPSSFEPGNCLEAIKYSIKAEFEGSDASPGDRRLIFILIARQPNDFVKTNLVPNLDYWHHRSGEGVSIFCLGFGRSSQFSEARFVKDLEVLEANSNWKYSGKSDLIVCGAKYLGRDTSPVIEFDETICLTLESLKGQANLKDAGAFLECIIRLSKTCKLPSEISNGLASELISISGKNVLTSIVPKPLKAPADLAFEFRVRDIRRR